MLTLFECEICEKTCSARILKLFGVWELRICDGCLRKAQPHLDKISVNDYDLAQMLLSNARSTERGRDDTFVSDSRAVAVIRAADELRAKIRKVVDDLKNPSK